MMLIPRLFSVPFSKCQPVCNGLCLLHPVSHPDTVPDIPCQNQSRVLLLKPADSFKTLAGGNLILRYRLFIPENFQQVRLPVLIQCFPYLLKGNM